MTDIPPVDLSQAPLSDVYKRLECDGNGLTTSEATRRLEQSTHHSVHNRKRQPRIITQFLSFLWNPVSWMLEASALGLLALSSGLHRPPDWPTFLGIILLLCVNSTIGVFAERRAFRAVSSLRQSSKFATSLAMTAKVKRDRLWSRVPASRLVPGDIMRLQTEDVVLANCRVTSGSLYLFESDADVNSRKRVDDPCFLGQKVSIGSCDAIVIPTDTSFLASPSHGQPNSSATGLHAIVAQIGIFCLAVISVLLVAEILVLYAGFHYNYHRGINAIFVLLLGSIPITLPTAVSVALSVGVDELASREVLTTGVSAVEELARVTVLCVEQCALTEDDYTISEVRTYGPFSASEVLLMAAYAQSTESPQRSPSSSYNGDYYDGVPVGHPDIEIVDYKPLSVVDGPIRVTYRTRGSTQLKRVAKGMVGHVASMWTRNHTNATEDQLEADVEELVHLGVSASALAYEEVEGDDPEADGNGFELIGIVGFSQALRENAEQAVGEVLATGVQMKLVTWSQLTISKAIGRRVGLGDRMFAARVLKDDIFQGMPLDTLILEAAGFAGVRPIDAKHLLRRLQHMGHLCATINKGISNELGSGPDVSITIGTGGDLVATQPCLPKVIEAIQSSRQVFQRLRGCFIYACAICIRTVLCFPLLAFIYKIDFPPFMILLVALTTDIATLTLTVDRVAPGTKPARWNLTEIFSYSTAYGVYMALSTVLFVVATKVNFFQRTFGLALSTSEPQQDNQLHMLIYLQVVQISHALIFVVRSERLSVCRRPSAVLLGVFCVAQIISSIIAAYGNWESASVNAVTAGWIGLVWLWNIIWFIPLEFVKFGVGFTLRVSMYQLYGFK